VGMTHERKLDCRFVSSDPAPLPSLRSDLSHRSKVPQK
jgi:hypothetical protein